MGTRLSVAARNTMVDAVTLLIDAGAVGKIRVYNGTQPATPDTAITTETLLAEFTLADPSFGASSSGTSTLGGTPLVTTGLAAGTAGWFRVLNAANAAVYDGTAGTSGTQLILNTTTISVGVDIQITAGSFTMPTGS